MGKLSGKVAVVTGANSGIGLATAKRFAQEGARVFMSGRRQRELDAAVAEVGENARGIQGDVSILADLDLLFAIVKEEAGTIDVLFANAGGGEFAALGEITEEHFDKTFATNVKGTLFTVQKALPLLKDGASVILTGSTTEVTGGPSFSVYSASKAAQDPRQCACSGRNLHTGMAWPRHLGRSEQGDDQVRADHDTAWPPWRSVRDCECGTVPCVR
jgi:NAD(P)-dependent dehydrogenase (short-subunit alcohol dehydrogenase family)